MGYYTWEVGAGEAGRFIGVAKQEIVSTSRQIGRAPGRRGGMPAALRVARTLVRGRWALMTLLVIAAAAVMIGLGFWQLGRLQGRRAANASIARQLAAPPLPLTARTVSDLDPAALTFRRVTIRGVYDYTNEIVLRYRTHNGQAGVHLLTPLRLADGEAVVLVDRGWIPYQQAEPDGRRAFQNGARGVVEIEGLVRQSEAREEQSAAGAGGEGGRGREEAWSRVDLAAIERQMPYPLLPFWVERLPAADEARPPFAAGLPRQGDGSHLSYALQWWAFTIILIVGYLAIAHSVVNPQRSRVARRSASKRPRTPS